MRNATVTTIAPTGTISLIAGCSSGIEPLFSLAATRQITGTGEISFVNRFARRCLEERGLWNEEIITRLSRTGSLGDCGLIPQDVRMVLATAHEIAPEWHVAHLAAAQAATDNAVSKTVNLPQNATPDDVAKVFMEAYRRRCKGVTVYRDGSRPEQVLRSGFGLCQECAV